MNIIDLTPQERWLVFLLELARAVSRPVETTSQVQLQAALTEGSVTEDVHITNNL